MGRNTDEPFTIYRVGDGEWLDLDGVAGEEHAIGGALSNHPVEDGSEVTDHYQALPDTFTVQGLVTASPLKGAGGSSADRATGTGRLVAARRFFRACAGQKLLVGTTRYGIVQDVLLVRWRDAVGPRAIGRFDLSFQVIKTVQGQTVTIPAKRATVAAEPGLSTAVDAGSCDPSAVDVTTGAGAEDRSTAYTIAQASGLVG